MKTSSSLGRRGQILPGAVAMLVILAVMVPSMVLWIQRETIFASKQSHNTTAFHLAEAGTEKAYLYISLSTITWNNIQAGIPQTDYAFDKAFSDIEGGTYAISITSGPAAQQVTIISVGRDRHGRETRALRVVYSNTVMGDTAIYAGQGVRIGGGANVHWGAVMSPGNIDATGRNFPQFWSASQIIGKDTDANPPNCDSPDCCQWHSFQTSLPTAPSIDFGFYRASAAATAGCPAGGTPAGSCYYAGNVSNWSHTTTGKTIFIEGNLSVKSPGMFHTGSMIVMGNINLPNGVWGRGTVGMVMPDRAWKQYCNAWGSYQAYGNDSTDPAAFPGINSDYIATVSPLTSNKISFNGFVYVGGNFNNGGGGGGNSDVYGILYAVGTSTLAAASPIDFYYNGNAAGTIVTTNVSLTRSSWQSDLRGWPTGL